MCGIVSIAYGEDNPDLGKEAAALLRRLEYRGYDSTGAAFIDAQGLVSLMKKVGAPSRVCRELGVERWGGRRFIGQVRWATYGAVTDLNCQPHHVRCKVEMVGAHNGNVSNTDILKPWLEERGHRVVSDNDGEIIVHLVEERLQANRAAMAASTGSPLAMARSALDAAVRAGRVDTETSVSDEALLLMLSAREADALAEGSYAAAAADPRIPGVVAMKSGSSLYAGLGRDARGEFVVVSSDLSSVLSKTRSLIPLAEGEGIWFTERDYLVFPLSGDFRLSRPKPKRSRLDVKDTALDPRYTHFMEQEIAAESETMGRVIRYYFADNEDAALAARLAVSQPEAERAAEGVLALAELSPAEAAAGLEALRSGSGFRSLAQEVRDLIPPAAKAVAAGSPFTSDERALFEDLARECPAARADLALLDAILVWKKRRETMSRYRDLLEALRDTDRHGGRTFLVASGTSYHAALVASSFFDELARFPVYPCNPGQFRSMYLRGLRDADLVIAISQSGETKDLVDALQDAAERSPGLRRASIVNNENSRIPQELSDFYLPILCGPETAVAATKSFTNQIAVLYALAAGLSGDEAAAKQALERGRTLVETALASSEAAINEAAERLFDRPSLHILGSSLVGLAREGALKVREVVLCHAEGYDAAEFKHGPNTILGKNTIFSTADIARAIALYREAEAADPSLRTLPPLDALKKRPEVLEGLFRNYPLIFVCPPEERDIKITVSQIHTHKIRGADVIVIAEPSRELALAASGRPAGDEAYWSKLIELPASGDPALFVFSAAAVLQRLAYRMSVLKAAWLDALGVQNHGVHPDVPKNVSKSITVD